MKNETKHTPGPWQYDATWALITGPNGEEICAVHAAQGKGETRCNRKTAAANAALIAAAPELMALAQAVRRLEQSTEGKGLLDLSSTQLSDLYAQARAAIAQVEVRGDK